MATREAKKKKATSKNLSVPDVPIWLKEALIQASVDSRRSLSQQVIFDLERLYTNPEK
jgi:hypothetical protein